MFNPRRILAFWGRALSALVPLFCVFALLAYVAIRSGEPPKSGWQWGLKLAIGLLPATLAVVAAFALGIQFLKALHGLKSRREVFWHLMHCMFGQASFKPWLLVEEGRINADRNPLDSLIVRAGGPGNVVVRKDSAAVLEKAGRLTKVVGPGFAPLERYERLYDSIDLRPRRWQLPVVGMSKEGIPVTCDVDVVFQIQSGDEKPTGERPFPADMDAVFTAATSKWIREADLPEGDRILDWKALVVVSGAQGTLRFILARYPLDRLIAPEREGETHPRRAIRDELEAALRPAANSVGARVLKVELGQIKVEDNVTQKWIESWRARWDRWGAEYLAEADAAYVKAVGEAQAEAIAKRIENTANVLHRLAVKSRHAFYAGARMQLQLMLRNVGADSLALTYLPGEATKLLQGPEET